MTLWIMGPRQPKCRIGCYFCRLTWRAVRLSIVRNKVIARSSNILSKTHSSYIPCGSISSYRPWLLLLFVRYILMMYMSSRVNLRFSLQWEFPCVEHRSGLPKRQRKPERFSWTFFQFFEELEEKRTSVQCQLRRVIKLLNKISIYTNLVLI